ncbi:MAG TPA: low-specificity L-threonine aldolase [Bacteroidia bacterium]|nr:low-specificity L-threonine aldolase [Bacteroidia bacterium]
MDYIDLRSDTVTRPSKAMLEAMLSAPLGDDVFSEDPTVNALQEFAAELFSMEAALFCPSGTMTNQIAIKVHTQPGDELLADVNSHIYNYEGGGIAFNSGVQARLIQGHEGRLSVEQIESNLNADQDWLTRTRLVSLENTVNRAGGSFYNLEQIKAISEYCRQKKLKLHLDGARIFNALAETGDKPQEIGKLVDSISVCLSKGLGAPVGSLLIGSRDFIRQARRIRKVFGGGMRQAGLLAAAGDFALRHNIQRLKEDHRKARSLAGALKQHRLVESILPVYTNIIIFNLKKDEISGQDFESALLQKGIRISAFGKQTIRLVTHLDFTESMLERTLEALSDLEKA